MCVCVWGEEEEGRCWLEGDSTTAQSLNHIIILYEKINEREETILLGGRICVLPGI